MLDMMGGVFHQHGPLPQVAAQAADLILRPEGARQQAVSVQLLQPLAVQHVALATRHVLDAPGINQHHFKPTLFQHPERWYPVNAGGLHGHGHHAALPQPVRQTVQVRRESLKLLYRLLRPVGGYRHEVAGGPHVDAGRFPVQLGQIRRFALLLLLLLIISSTVAV